MVFDDHFANPRVCDLPLNALVHDEGNLLMVHAKVLRRIRSPSSCSTTIVGSDVRPVTDAACAHLRVEGFSVQEEMTKLR